MPASTIKPYKFVNPNLITGMTGGKKGGATIIAAGKKITGPAESGGSADIKAGRTTLLSLNRIGATVQALGTTQQKINTLLLTENKLIQSSKEFRRKRDQYLKDQESESKQENALKKKQASDGEIKQESDKKVKEKKGLLETLFAPFRGIIEFAMNIMITQGVLRWIANPNNFKAIQTFVDTAARVFNFIFNVAYKSIDFFLTGVSHVFGDGSKQGFDRFREVLGGLGEILIGIAGFKALSYLNPFKLVGDLLGLLDIAAAGGGGLPELPGGKGKSKPKPKVKPEKPNVFSKLGDKVDDFKSGLGKGFGKFKEFGSNVSKSMRDKLAKSGEFMKDATKKAMRPIAEKAYKFLKDKGLIKLANNLGEKAVGVIKKMPGYPKIMAKIQKEGGQGVLKKLGGKSIPVIGGLVNLYFAYDRLKNGDKSGAALEALSAILDIAGLFTGGTTSALSMVLDTYLFGRDFFPDLVKKENEAFGSLLNSILGPINSIKDGLPKIPMLKDGGIVSKPTIAAIGENGPEAIVPLGKLNSLGGTAGTLAGGLDSALKRMGAAGEIARALIGNDIKDAENMFGIQAVAGGGGDTLGKSVSKGAKGLQIDAGDDISLMLGKDSVTITDRKNPQNKPTTLRGQLANVLSSLIWLSNKDLSSGGGGGGAGGKDGASSEGDPNVGPIEGGPMHQKGANIAKKLMSLLGIKDYQAAGIVGNIIQESSLVPDRVQGSGMKRGPLKLDGVTGYSYPQWTSIDRQKAFAAYMESKGFDWQKKGATDELATGFLAKEFKGYMSSVFKNTKDVASASNWVLRNYEKPADQGAREAAERAGDAKAVLAKMAQGGIILARDSKREDDPSRRIYDKSFTKIKGEAIGGVVKFAAGGQFKNGQLPDSALQTIGGGHKVRKGDVADSFKAMSDAAKKDGVNLVSGLTSSYRSLADQERVAKERPGFAAKPGTSKHGWGIALDVGIAKQQDWMHKNGSKYGWINPAWAKSSPYEPWHFEKSGAATGPTSDSGGSNTGTSPSSSSSSSEDDNKSAIDAMIKAFDAFAKPAQVSYSDAANAKDIKALQTTGNASIGTPGGNPYASLKPASSGAGSALSQSSQNWSVSQTLSDISTTVIPVPINTSSNVVMQAGAAPPVIRTQNPITRGFG